MTETETILVVDDSELILDLAAGELEDAGYQVHTALNIFAAMKMLREHNIRLVLLDLSLPGLAVEGLLDFLADTPVLVGANVVLFSAQPLSDLNVLVERYGLLGAIHKGGDEALPQAVARYLAMTVRRISQQALDRELLSHLMLFENLVRQDLDAARELAHTIQSWSFTDSHQRSELVTFLDKRLAEAEKLP